MVVQSLDVVRVELREVFADLDIPPPDFKAVFVRLDTLAPELNVVRASWESPDSRAA